MPVKLTAAEQLQQEQQQQQLQRLQLTYGKWDESNPNIAIININTTTIKTNNNFLWKNVFLLFHLQIHNFKLNDR